MQRIISFFYKCLGEHGAGYYFRTHAKETAAELTVIPYPSVSPIDFEDDAHPLTSNSERG